MASLSWMGHRLRFYIENSALLTINGKYSAAVCGSLDAGVRWMIVFNIAILFPLTTACSRLHN
jgi:hypothetical protein